MKLYCSLLLLCLGISGTVFSSEDPPEFLPHMLDHPFAGCPENSQCERGTGQLFEQWSQLSSKINSKDGPKKLNSFRQSKGMPLKLWAQADLTSVSSGQALPPVVLWDSACPKLKQQKRSEGVYFAADFKALKTQAQAHPQLKLHFHHALVMGSEAEPIVDYLIPKDETPQSIKQQALYFTIEENGHYLGLWVEASGSLKLSTSQKVEQGPERVPCPAKLIQHYQTTLEKNHFYDGFYCLVLKEQGKNKSYTLLIGHTCN